MSRAFKMFLRFFGEIYALKNDPLIKQYKEWQKAINQLLKMGVRAEQQALAKHGLNYVIEKYLPQKLKKADSFLP